MNREDLLKKIYICAVSVVPANDLALLCAIRHLQAQYDQSWFSYIKGVYYIHRGICLNYQCKMFKSTDPLKWRLCLEYSEQSISRRHFPFWGFVKLFGLLPKLVVSLKRQWTVSLNNICIIEILVRHAVTKYFLAGGWCIIYNSIYVVCSVLYNLHTHRSNWRYYTLVIYPYMNDEKHNISFRLSTHDTF